MFSSDVIIAGAGPAGSTCAARLQQAGLRVQLFDKKQFPRVKPCAGWITPQVIAALQLDIEDYHRQHTFQPITGFRTGMIGGRMVETTYERPVSFGIRRIEFDDYLLRRSGVSCEFTAVRDIVRNDDGQWIVNDRYTAPLIIGAGGHFCPVARYLQNGKPVRHADSSGTPKATRDADPWVVYAQEVEFEMSSRQQSGDYVLPHRPELYFCPDLQGYGWCFAKGNVLNVGLGRVDKQNLSAHVAEFCDFLRQQKRLVDELPEHFLGHAYKLYMGSRPRLFDDGLLLVGDAAGLAYPNSGEGIRPAIESAILAAEVIRKNRGDYDSQTLAEYDSLLSDRLGKPASGSSGKWLPVALLRSLAARLMATGWFARKVVIENWFLHSRQEALID